MNRRTLTMTIALLGLAFSILTTALANTGRTTPVSDVPTPNTQTVSSILTPAPLHGLTNAVVSGVYTLYQQAENGITSCL